MSFDPAALYDPRTLGVFAAMFAFRALPFAVWSLLPGKTRALTALGLATLSSASIVAAASLDPGARSGIAALLAALLYYAVANIGLHAASSSLPRSRIGSYVIFPMLFMVYVVIPAWSFGLQRSITFLLVSYGFERALAAYSYCHSAITKRTPVSLPDCLFFLTVSPEIVFSSLARRCDPNFFRGCGRALGGAMLMWVADTLRRMTPPKPPLATASIGAGMAHGAWSFVLLYAMAAALAHMQIGFSLAIGYRALERYDYPIGAVSPRDFWLRWNRYVGAWLARYVYGPIVRAAGDRRARARRHVLGTLSAFAWSGVLHDSFWYVVQGSFVYVGVLGFCLWGLIGLAWTPLERLMTAARGWQRMTVRVSSRLAFLFVVSASAWIFA